jgi:hypothetical protein
MLFESVPPSWKKPILAHPADVAEVSDQVERHVSVVVFDQALVLGIGGLSHMKKLS